MFLATLDDVLELRARLGHPEHLRITLDLGHLVCNEPRPPAATAAGIGGLTLLQAAWLAARGRLAGALVVACAGPLLRRAARTVSPT